MNFKRFISGVSALTIAVSAFASMAVTASAGELPDIVKEVYSTIDGAIKYDGTPDFKSDEVTFTNWYKGSGSFEGGAIALIKFDITDELAACPETHRLAKAELTIDGKKTSSNNATINIGALPKLANDWTAENLTKADVTAATGNANPNDISAVYADNLNYKSITADVTRSFNDVDKDGIVTLAICTTGREMTMATSRHSSQNAPKLKLTFSEKEEVESITLNYQTEAGETIKAVSLDATDVYANNTSKATSAYVGDKLNIPFSKYIIDNGELYKIDNNSSDPWYGNVTTMTKDTVVNKTATKVELPEGTTVVAFVEGEGSTADNAGIRSSGMSSTRGTINVGNVEPGVYEVEANSYSRNNNTYVYLNGEKLVKLNVHIGGFGSETTKVIVPEAGELTVGPDGGSDYVDYVLLKKTGDYTISPVAAAAAAVASSTEDEESVFVSTVSGQADETYTMIVVEAVSAGTTKTATKYANITGAGSINIGIVITNRAAEAVDSVTVTLK